MEKMWGGGVREKIKICGEGGLQKKIKHVGGSAKKIQYKGWGSAKKYVRGGGPRNVPLRPP